MNDSSHEPSTRVHAPKSITGRAAAWVAYGAILTGATAFASLSAGSEASGGRGPVLRFERSTTMGASLTLAEEHSLEMGGLVLEVGDADPVSSSVKLHVWSGVLSYLVDEIDPQTGLLCRRYDRSKGVIQSGQIDESGQEYRGPEMPLVSPLEDIGVAFTPKSSAPAGFARHYDSSKALNETLLPRLAPPRDWGTLLPPLGADGVPKRVELGAEWDVAPAALACALSPTGDLLMEGGEGMEPRMLRAYLNGVGGSLHLGFEGIVDGTAKARFVQQGADPDDGNFADIEIDFDIALSVDRGEFIKENRAIALEDLDGELLAVDLEQSFRGKVKLRWSLDSNGPISCATDCDESVIMAVQLAGVDGTASRQTVTMIGDLNVAVAFQPVPLRRSARAQ